MKIRALEVENWGPFVGKHSVDLSVGASAPVVVIHGENGRGKTSIMRAIFWSLYGGGKDSYGLPIPLEKLVNHDPTGDSGKGEFEVKLKIEFESSVYEISRGGRFRRSPEGVHIENTEFALRPKGSAPYSEAKAIETINLILEEAIADFYLFDGEKLSSVEKKLSKSESDPQFVQKSVERALGLSFIDRLKTDLEYIRSDYSDVLTTHEKLETATRKLIDKQAEISSEIARNKVDVSEIAKIRAGLEGEVAEINKSLQVYEQIRDQVVRRQILTQNEKDATARVVELRQKLKGEAEVSWHWPLSQVLEKFEEDRLKHAHERMSRLQLESDLKSRVELIRSSLLKHTCSMCGAGVGHDAQNRLEVDLNQLEAELNAISSAGAESRIPDLAILTNQAKRSARLPLLLETLSQLGEAEVNLEGLRGEISELNNKIGSSETPDILKLEDDRDQCVIRISQATDLISKLEGTISGQRDQLHSIQQKLRDSPELDPVARKRLAIIDGLSETLMKSYDSFREAMRVQVENASSTILQSLSSEKDYQSVSISSRYQVSMLDSQKQVVPIPSSGYSQILALSFIGGLADVAGSKNAVVMDTPWGRVDRGNRKLIMNWIKGRSNQTIILVQSGELTPQEAREEFGGRLGRQLSLERVSMNSSKIVEV